MMMKKILALLITGTMAAGMFIGCGSSSASSTSSKNATSTASSTSTESSSEENSGTMEIVVSGGDTVVVPTPENLKGYIITSWTGQLEATCLLGVTKYVLGMCYSGRYGWIYYHYPEIAEAPDYGGMMNALDIEGILESGADYVFTTPTDELEEAGIVCVSWDMDMDDSLSMEGYRDEGLEVIATLTGTEDVLGKYYEWVQDTFALVQERVADIPDEEKKTVMPMRMDVSQIYGINNLQGLLCEWAGGLNVSRNIDNAEGMQITIDAEQLLEWDPEYIFRYNLGETKTEESLAYYEELAADEVYSQLTAVQNGDVYMIPSGIGGWSSTLEAPLGELWMASIMYPELFEDIDVKAYAEDFYKEFLGVEMTDVDWDYIAWQFDGANSNGLTG